MRSQPCCVRPSSKPCRTQFRSSSRNRGRHCLAGSNSRASWAARRPQSRSSSVRDFRGCCSANRRGTARAGARLAANTDPVGCRPGRRSLREERSCSTRKLRRGLILFDHDRDSGRPALQKSRASAVTYQHSLDFPIPHASMSEERSLGHGRSLYRRLAAPHRKKFEHA